MRREGRQHGMVRTYPILSSPRPRHLNELGSPPTAGLFNKVSTKPTNHSKFTGKCGRAMCRDCHIYPACKSKDKVKGAHKIRSLSQSGLITWRAVDTNRGFKLTGLSATGMLDYLAGDEITDREYEDGYLNDHEVEEVYKHNEVPSEIDSKDNADQMSFYEVGLVWQTVDEDEGWCLVEEIM